MKIPFIGEVKRQQPEPIVQTVEVPKKSKGFLLGTFLDLGQRKLSDEKSISTKLLESFYGWTYINVTTLAEEVSKFEPELYKTTIKGGEIVAEPVTDHPLLDLLDRFNSTTSRSEGFYLTEAFLEMTGDSFWYLEGGANGGQPTGIYLLQPDKVELNIAGDGTVTGYTFKTTIDGKSKEVSYEFDEILHIKVPSPTNPYRGHSVVEGIADQLDIDAYTTQTTRSFYENGMMANFVLSTDQKLTGDQLKKLRAEMRSAYQGTQNAFKVPIFGGGISVQQLSTSSKDAEQLKQQAWLRDQIMAAFKNTKASLGIVEDVNRANAESTIDFWRQSVVLPKMQRIAAAINEFLVPRYGDNLLLGVKDPAGEDYESQTNEAIKLKSAGIISRNEAREMLGYDQVEGGDLFPDQVALTDEKSVPKSIKNIDYKRILAKNGMIDKRNKYRKEYLPEAKKIVQEMHSHKHKAVAPSKKNFSSFTFDQAVEYNNKQIEIVNAQEKQFENAINQYLDQLVKRTADKVSVLLRKKAYKEEMIDEEAELLLLTAAVGTIMVGVALSGGNQANKLIGVDNPYLLDDSTKKLVDRQINKFGGSVIDTNRNKIADIIAEGLNNGNGPSKVANAIRTQMPEFSKMQATRVARTELLTTINNSAIDAWKKSGVVRAKQWVTKDPCPYCAPMEGKIIGLDDNYFEKGDEWLGEAKSPIKLDYRSITAPPLHPNCECGEVPVLIDTKGFDVKSNKRLKKLEAELQKERDYVKELEEVLEITDGQA